MQLTIGVSDTDEAAELRDLFRWLRADEDGPDEVWLSGEPPTGSMGGGLEVVNVVLTHTMAVANFALAYATWRRARRGRAALTFTRASDGVSVTLENGSDEAVRALIAALSEPPAAAPLGAPDPPALPAAPDTAAPGDG
ncbi:MULTISPECIES: hypothetical protein [unclassified Streptomyces]|uniref:effector-associated constant component EACC1 n=1 Tax=unclassified Streptomyces TaxID=2593676 RepID=UPI000DC7A46F|nr:MULTISPECIES: hypothetical protein [unclassified Streptomyces]AWZ04040.1 hypothetical protein DRB89_04675 [Streptomyces sp. ICC4]AWZ12184.1 hypothetical protein DRB96_07500 [Streptomyces sp. ICC1]